MAVEPHVNSVPQLIRSGRDRLNERRHHRIRGAYLRWLQATATTELALHTQWTEISAKVLSNDAVRLKPPYARVRGRGGPKHAGGPGRALRGRG